MLATDRRAARRTARVLVVPAALAALAVAAPQAAAHTDLEASSPAKGATLAGLPPQLTLTFSDPMTQKYAKVAVTGPAGTSVADGEPQADGKAVTLALTSGSTAGRYTVGYRVVSKDGHPVSGSYTFTVNETAAPSSPPTPTPTNQAAAPPTASTPKAEHAAADAGTSSGSTTPLLAGAGVLAAAALGAGLYLRRHRQARHGD